MCHARRGAGCTTLWSRDCRCAGRTFFCERCLHRCSGRVIPTTQSGWLLFSPLGIAASAPAVLSTLLSVVGVWYFFLPPFHSFALQNPQVEISGMVGFLAFSGFIIALGEANCRSKARSETDVVKRRRIEEELRKAQQELEHRVKERTAELEQNVAETREKASLLDLANDAIFVKSVNGAISYWNQGAERLYGWSKEEAISRSSHELLRTEFPIPLAEIETRDYWEGELRHTRRNGVQIVVASRWTTVRDKDGEPVAWLEINTDITSPQACRSSRS
jgi:PAS domain S-box-containing protein